jgi:RsiW-degrading membrane proteinase PrsW (M82 family)
VCGPLPIAGAADPPPAAPRRGPLDDPGSFLNRAAACGCVGCFGLAFFLGMSLFLVAAIPDPVALGLAAAAAILPVPTFVFMVLLLDRYEREPWQLGLAAFLWGALVATFFSAIFNSGIGAVVSAIVGDDVGEVITASVVAPVVEETAKGLALLLLFVVRKDEFDGALDGIVYGALVGIGFAMTENILYFGRVYLEGGLIGIGVLAYIRVGLGGFGHALYTGTLGAALGYARESRHRVIDVILPIVGYILAVFQHSAWNFIAGSLVPSVLPDRVNPLLLLFVVMPLQSLILTGPGLLTLVVIAVFAWRREAAVIRTYLQEEVAAGAVTPAEYAELPSQRARFGREMAALRRRGPGGWLAQRDLHQAATELAFRKWHLSRGTLPTGAQKVTPEDRYRQRIAVLRARLA